MRFVFLKRKWKLSDVCYHGAGASLLAFLKSGCSACYLNCFDASAYLFFHLFSYLGLGALLLDHFDLVLQSELM